MDSSSLFVVTEPFMWEGNHISKYMTNIKNVSKQIGRRMTKSGKGKICLINKKSATRFVSIPSSVAGDTSFPFADEERVKVTISGRTVIIEPLEE